jgi:hypothetical protein
MLDVSVTLPPAQNFVAPPVLMVGAGGSGVTLIVVAVDAGLLQPLTVAMTV